MKIGVQCKVSVVGKNKREYDRKDGGGKGTSYTVAIIQDGQCANIPCSEDVYMGVLLNPQMPMDVDVYMLGTFDDVYKTFKFDNVVPANHVKNVSAK